MKRWICGLAAAGLILAGGMGVSADDLRLPGGSVLPLGKDVTVWQGKDSYLAPKVQDFLKDPQFEQKIAEEIMKVGTFAPSEKREADFLAKEIVKYLQNSQVYQLRGAKGTTMYTAYAFSVPVTLPLRAEELSEWNRVAAAFVAHGAKDPKPMEKELKEHGELGQSVNMVKTVLKAENQKKGVSKGGLSYDMSDVFITPEVQGVAFPLYVYGLGLTKGETMTVTVIFADQPSGQYFQRYLKKGAEEAK